MQQAIALLALVASASAFVAPLAARPSQQCVALSAATVEVPAAAPPTTGVSTPDTSLTSRFGDLRGRDVKPVSESLQTFNKIYRLPINPGYRTLVIDVLQSIHLTTVDARFKYDAVFALGLRDTFLRLMGGYPGAQAEPILSAMITALDLDPATIAADAAALKSWASSGVTEADVAAALRGEGDSVLADVAKAATADEFYLYSKNWSLGLVQVLEAAGVKEVSEEAVVAMTHPLGFPDAKVRQDLQQYKDVVARTEQIETLFKEIEIREKKKMAGRLEEKARRALDAAQKAEAATETTA